MEWDHTLAGFIDHTVIKAATTEENVRRACQEALCFGFASVVVSPFYLPIIAGAFQDSLVKTCTIVSFPLGAQTPEEKAEAADRYIRWGAQELDVVMNIGALLSGRSDIVRKEILSVASVCRGRAVFKLIIETACLSEAQIAIVTRMAAKHGADYVKTSTGFSDRGATVRDVEIIKEVAGDRIGIKASGGITTPKQARALLDAGATRLGCSSSHEVIGLRS